MRAGVQPSAAVITLQATGPGALGEALFVGRNDPVDQVLRALAPNAAGPAVVVVHGMGGIGKTTMARQAARLAIDRDWFPAGAVMVDLDGYGPSGSPVAAEQVFAPLLRALGVPGQQIPPTLSEQATEYHRLLDRLTGAGQRLLVVLDNVANVAQVRALLSQGAVHRVLITSRDLLPIRAGSSLELEVMSPTEALDLLRATLTGLHGTDRRINGEPEATQNVLGWCGGLPLAIEITGGVLAADVDLTMAQLDEELKDTTLRLDVMDDGTGGVHAAFDMSWRLLRNRDELAARVMCLLTVNPGPDMSDAIAAAIAGLDTPAARTRLRVLTHAHLLEARSGRRRFHDLVRLDIVQHAIPELGITSKDLTAATDRLLDHYQSTAWAADRHLRALPGEQVPDRFGSRGEALAWLDTERPNLIAAVTLAANTHRDSITVDLASSLAEFLDRRGQFTDALMIAQLACRTVQALDDRPRDAATWNHLGLALSRLRQFNEAASAHRKARDIYRDIEDKHGESQALNNLGLALRSVRMFDESIAAHEQDLMICQASSDLEGEATAWNNLGIALREYNQFDAAITAHSRALDIYRRIRDSYGEGRAQNDLGSALLGIHEIDAAIDAHTSAAFLLLMAEDRIGQATALNNLGADLQSKQQFEKGITAHRRAREIYRSIGDRHGEGEAIWNLALALRAIDHRDEAIAALTDAVEIFRETDDRRSEGLALLNLGIVFEDLGRLVDVRAVWGLAMQALSDAGDEKTAETVSSWLHSLDTVPRSRLK